MESSSTSESEDVEETLSSRRPRRHKAASSREKRAAEATKQALREMDDSEADTKTSKENSSDPEFQPVKSLQDQTPDLKNCLIIWATFLSPFRGCKQALTTCFHGCSAFLRSTDYKENSE